MTVNNFISGVNSGFGVVDRYQGMKRQKVQQGKEDDAWDRQKLIQDRTLAFQDLDLALKSNDFVMFSEASKTLGLSVPSFESKNFNANKGTYENWIGGKEPVSSDGMASLLNDVMRQDIAKREGANPNYQYRVNRLVPSQDGKGFQVELKVRDKETGKVWNAPMTDGATVGQGKVQTIPVDKVVKRLEGYFQVGDAVHADPENSKEFDEALAYIRSETKKKQQNNYMQQQRDSFGVGPQTPAPKEPKSHVINDQLVTEQPDGSFGVQFDGRDQETAKPETKIVNGQLLESTSEGWKVVHDGRDVKTPDAPETKIVNNQLLERSENGWVMQYDGRDDKNGSNSKREMKQDANGRWRFIDDSALVFPDLEVTPKSSDASPYSGLAYDRAVETSMATVQGLSVDDLGQLTSEFPAEDGRISTKLAALASNYAQNNSRGGRIMPHTEAADYIAEQANGLTLNIEEAMDQLALEQEIDLSDKLLKKKPEQFQANQQQLMGQARMLIDRNIEILQDRLAPKTEHGGQSKYSNLW